MKPSGIAKRWPTLLLVKQLGRIVTHRFTVAFEPLGIRPRHVATLIELRDHGELTQQSLYGRLNVDPTNLVAILNELEQKGYVTRRRDPEDRRRHIVAVSKKGLGVIEKGSKIMDEMEGELLEGLSASERHALSESLASIWETSGGTEAYVAAADVEEEHQAA
jgi:DNA-binding MarR family transcriptional regulator